MFLYLKIIAFYLNIDIERILIKCYTHYKEFRYILNNKVIFMKFVIKMLLTGDLSYVWNHYVLLK